MTILPQSCLIPAVWDWEEAKEAKPAKRVFFFWGQVEKRNTAHGHDCGCVEDDKEGKFGVDRY